MIANFVVKTQEHVFPVGTIAGYWRWDMTDITDQNDIPLWQTKDPVSSKEVIEDHTYIIECWRVSDSHSELGPKASTRFTATITEPPEGEMIEVADSMMVTLQ